MWPDISVFLLQADKALVVEPDTINAATVASFDALALSLQAPGSLFQAPASPLLQIFSEGWFLRSSLQLLIEGRSISVTQLAKRHNCGRVFLILGGQLLQCRSKRVSQHTVLSPTCMTLFTPYHLSLLVCTRMFAPPLLPCW